MTAEEFTEALDAVRDGLVLLARLDDRRMTKEAADLAYQAAAAFGAQLAHATGHPDLGRRLDIGAVRCHSCP